MILFLFLLLVTSSFSQTNTGGLTPKGVFDASGASSTSPAKSGTSLPGTCVVGQLFFKTDATNIAVLHGCTTTNVWTQQTGSVGSTTNQNIRIVPFNIDSGTGNTLSGTIQRCGTVFFSGTIQAVSMMGNVTGSATMDVGTVRLTSYTGPSSASSITAAAIPAMSNVFKYIDTTLTGWTTTITSTTANPTIVCFTVTGEASLQWLHGALLVAAN